MTSAEGVVLGRKGNRFRVLVGGETCWATLSGRLKHDSQSDHVVAGDQVLVESLRGDAARITAVMPRRSLLARRAGDAPLPKAVAANVDQVVVVAAARDPEPNPRMLDRLVVIAEANRLAARIVVNKIDLDSPWPERLQDRYRPAGYDVIPVSATGASGIARLREVLEGATSVLTGASGVGKTSLLNAVEPGLGLRTREISAYWRTGKHTTVAAELVPLREGRGFVVDTPGLREVALWNVRPHELGPCFPEFRPYLDQCRFADCRHLDDAGCAVRAAAAAGAFDGDRLATYQRLLDEAARAARPWT